MRYLKRKTDGSGGRKDNERCSYFEDGGLNGEGERGKGCCSFPVHHPRVWEGIR